MPSQKVRSNHTLLCRSCNIIVRVKMESGFAICWRIHIQRFGESDRALHSDAFHKPFGRISAPPSSTSTTLLVKWSVGVLKYKHTQSGFRNTFAVNSFPVQHPACADDVTARYIETSLRQLDIHFFRLASVSVTVITSQSSFASKLQLVVPPAVVTFVRSHTLGSRTSTLHLVPQRSRERSR